MALTYNVYVGVAYNDYINRNLLVVTTTVFGSGGSNACTKDATVIDDDHASKLLHIGIPSVPNPTPSSDVCDPQGAKLVDNQNLTLRLIKLSDEEYTLSVLTLMGCTNVSINSTFAQDLIKAGIPVSPIHFCS
ncbi:hypothetical protein SAMN04487866_101318 [Thermoactinomyces sp. DSM 45891]|uniref:hypothetical protein n=1 Tax=Thermoactinomyces sp. DSM 45891 TaxID=1761907 RepID=UPI0009174B28|nr:hypothetical protein [Thermoactinomyces sp. DSM 45891]SFX04634.1 hypothetical protein SAMN04487866_101318 [Thermoactinomyces sp. DSM 45891]